MMVEAKEITRELLCGLLDSGITEWTQLKSQTKDALSEYLYAKTKRKPMILPVIMNV
jgi:ribonuclease J